MRGMWSNPNDRRSTELRSRRFQNPRPGEAFITLYTPQPTPALHELVRAMESEFDELGRTVHIQVRRPAWSLRGWLARWGRHLLGFR